MISRNASFIFEFNTLKVLQPLLPCTPSALLGLFPVASTGTASRLPYLLRVLLTRRSPTMGRPPPRGGACVGALVVQRVLSSWLRPHDAIISVAIIPSAFRQNL